MAVTTITKVPAKQARGGGEIMYACYNGATLVGIITKAKNTRSDLHPWKVFKRDDPTSGAHASNTLIAAFFTDEDRLRIGPEKFDADGNRRGGKVAAFACARRFL